MTSKSARARRRRRASRGAATIPAARRPLTPSPTRVVAPAHRGPWLTLGALLASAALHSANPSALFGALPGRHFPGVDRSNGEQNLPAQQPPAWQFAISPGPLGEVLDDVARVTGAQFSFTMAELRTIQPPGVTGLLTLEQAVSTALDAAGMVAHFTDGRHVVLDLEGQMASVDVVGRSVGVASPKYVVPAREIPQTVAVIPRAVMEAQAASTLSEALRNVPGNTMQAGEGGGASNTAGDMFNLRGFNAANSLFVDGVRDDGLISRDTFNLEQVEVFMGPTGTDVGRGTAAGYVNIETKTPRATAEQSVLVSAGTSDQKRATADLNVPVRVGRSGTWLNQSAFRLNLLWQDGGTPGRDLVRHQGRSVAPSIALGLQTSTRIVASAQVVRQDNLPDYGVPGAAWLESPLAPTTQVAARPVNQRNFYGSAEADYDTAAQNTALARVEHDLTGPVALRNQTRYNKTTREAVISAIQNVAAFTPATNLVTLSRQGNLRENSILSNVSSVVARFMTGRLRHALTAGVEVTKEEQRAPGLTGLGIKAPVDIFVPDPDAPVSGFAPTRSGTYGNGAVDTLAAYGSDAVDVGTRWQLSGALRAERYFARFASLTAAGVQTDERTSDVLLSGKVGTLFTAAYLDSAAHSQNPLNHGRRLPLTPLFSGSLWTTYRLPHGLAVGGGLRHTGPVFVDSANTIRVPGYRLVDLVAEYPVNRMLSLRLNVSNVTDAVYIRNVNNNGGRCLVRDDGARTLLFDLDSAIQQLGAETPDHPVSLQLTGVYHNLLRRWAEA